jgi:hypothetical protein
VLVEFLQALILVPLAIVAWRSIAALLVNRWPKAANAITSAT